MWLLALGALAWWALASWADDGEVAVAGDGEVDTAVTVAQATTTSGLRLHLMTPLHLVAEHRSPVRVALTDAEGRALDDDTRLVVYAAVRAPDDGPAPVVVEGPPARPMSAGELAVTPLRLLPAGEAACGQVVAELRVRVALVDDQPSDVEQVRELVGPDCDGPDVVPAPDTVNLQRPVWALDAGWHDDLDRLTDPPVRRERQPRRAPAPEPSPSDPEPSDPEPSDPEPSDPQPTDPGPTDPEPTAPDPGPTEPSPGPSGPDPGPSDPAPDPEPDPQPTEPKPSPPDPPAADE